MKVLTFIKNNFSLTIILILLVIIFVGRCTRPSIRTVQVIKRDTIWVTKSGKVVTKPAIVSTIYVPSIDTIYVPSGDYNKLFKQYNDLLFLYFQKKTQKDTLHIASMGWVSVTDTVFTNTIIGRLYDYHLQYPKVKETIITNRNQLYVGGSLQGNPINAINQINTGLLFKNKKDQIFGASLGINTAGQLQYGISSYFKIKFRK